MAVRKQGMVSGWREVWGIPLPAVGVLLFLSLMSYHPEDIGILQWPSNHPALNYIGPAGAWAAFAVLMLFGVGACLLPPGLLSLGLFLLFKREGRVWPKGVWLLVILLAACVLAELAPGPWQGWLQRMNVGSAGGVAGHFLTEDVFALILGRIGAGILAVTAILTGIFFVFETPPQAVWGHLAVWGARLAERWTVWRDARRDQREQIEREQRDIAKRRRRLEEAVADSKREQPVAPARPAGPPVPEQPARPRPEPKPAPEPKPVAVQVKTPEPPPRPSAPPPEKEPAPPPAPPRPRPEPKPAPAPASAPKKPAAENKGPANYKMPTMDLLEALPADKDREFREEHVNGAALLKETLNDFGVDADVVHSESGPTVTLYHVLPASGVRVERIANLANNIALAMKAESVRIQAPIPGKGVVGIEVPNLRTTMVFLREVLESERWQSGKDALPLALGKDVGGRVLVSDLAEMPHLLIAGATGSGKSVCMNSVLAGLLMSRSPDEMKLVLVDPKRVEFAAYKELPHLIMPVVTDAKKVNIGLRWAINEMEHRYKLFAKVGVRNIKSFNNRPVARQQTLFAPPDGAPVPEEDVIPDRLPYIVIIVDELADLMMEAKAEIETSVCRLAQMSRATGIHMIIATQRPSVNVITGTIKANVPGRIAFQVAQGNDSRTILDSVGAEKLLGKGDMLFQPPATSKLVRAQGTWTADADIHRLANFWRAQGVPTYEKAVTERIESTGVELPEMEEDDELVKAAIEVIRQSKRASTSSIQRRLRIGYTRAARIMDLLEQRGIIGPPTSDSGPREILVDLDGEIPSNAAGGAAGGEEEG